MPNVCKIISIFGDIIGNISILYSHFCSDGDLWVIGIQGEFNLYIFSNFNDADHTQHFTVTYLSVKYMNEPWIVFAL